MVFQRTVGLIFVTKRLHAYQKHNVTWKRIISHLQSPIVTYDVYSSDERQNGAEQGILPVATHNRPQRFINAHVNSSKASNSTRPSQCVK